MISIPASISISISITITTPRLLRPRKSRCWSFYALGWARLNTAAFFTTTLYPLEPPPAPSHHDVHHNYANCGYQNCIAGRP